MTECFINAKTSRKNAIAMADLLAEADYRGHFSHGMNRLEMYINDLLKNSTDGETQPEILNETPATAWVDGKNGLGAVVGNFCMDLAIQKAKQVGVGVVAAKSMSFFCLILFHNNNESITVRIKSLWNCWLVHNSRDETEYDWSERDKYLAINGSN